MYAAGTDKYPVCNPDSPQYLSVANAVTSDVWYKNQPDGKEVLGKFMKTMAQGAGLEEHKTNHSVRKTMISCLVNKMLILRTLPN